LIDRGEHDEDKSRRSANAAGDQLGDLDVEADEFRRIARIGLDERRAAFRVSRPSQRCRLRCTLTLAEEEQDRQREVVRGYREWVTDGLFVHQRKKSTTKLRIANSRMFFSGTITVSRVPDVAVRRLARV
jgi:hypothetical protein